VPKGDPSLGEKLAHLSKDARKQIKSSDADRIARRLAKKKARMALAVDGVKPKLKDRERVRKPTVAKKGPAPHKKRSKGKVMNEKSLARRNVKK
jgi:nucleolar protein 12